MMRNHALLWKLVLKHESAVCEGLQQNTIDSDDDLSSESASEFSSDDGCNDL